jgi:hypothetical protein
MLDKPLTVGIDIARRVNADKDPNHEYGSAGFGCCGALSGTSKTARLVGRFINSSSRFLSLPSTDKCLQLKGFSACNQTTRTRDVEEIIAKHKAPPIS